MKTITLSYAMKASPKQVFAALTDPAIIQKWSGAPAEMDANVGTKFSMFGGGILGANLEVVPNQKLVQEWGPPGWEKPSKVTFTLVPAAAGTNVELLHEGVPDEAHDTINSGWDTSYLGQMQKMFAA